MNINIISVGQLLLFVSIHPMCLMQDLAREAQSFHILESRYAKHYTQPHDKTATVSLLKM